MMSLIFTTAGLLALAVVLYSYLETKMLMVKHLEIYNAICELKGKRVVIFGDTHVGGVTPVTRLRKWIECINAQKGDYVFFVGDLPDKWRSDYEELQKKTVTYLSDIKATKGKYAVLGNNDLHMKEAARYAVTSLEAGGFVLLINSGRQLCPGAYLGGITGQKQYCPGVIDKAMAGAKAGDYKILLSHLPDVADEAAEKGIDLQFSGHSHGGQIYVPFMQRMLRPVGAKKYYRGTYQISPKTTLHITSGLGVHTVPFRLFTPPDITVIDFL